ncbi:MAG: teichoic acid glycosylation protein [Firmicutes bacterium]|nr:teichoic acid glycosylation protein [Bacillota bacterium]
MKKLVQGETGAYILFGILTTVVNFVSYMGFTKLMHLDYKVSASLAWILAVVFAFITNKLFVFKSEETNRSVLVKEASGFLFFRGLSYFVDIFSIIVLVEWLGVYDAVSKIIASGIVAVFNYIASKYVIFRLRLKTGE